MFSPAENSPMASPGGSSAATAAGRPRSNTINTSAIPHHINNDSSHIANRPANLSLSSSHHESSDGSSPGSGESSGSQTTARSPKLFLNCVAIRQRSRSLSTSSNTHFPGALGSRPSGTRSALSISTSQRQYSNPPQTCGSPESIMSSTFPPPRRELYSGDSQSHSLPNGGSALRTSKLSQFDYESSDSDDYNMDSDSDNGMESDGDVMMDDNDEMPFKMEQKQPSKKRVTWRNDDNLVQLHTYKSDSRYYERNPFYGFGRIEYGSDDEEPTSLNLQNGVTTHDNDATHATTTAAAAE